VTITHCGREKNQTYGLAGPSSGFVLGEAFRATCSFNSCEGIINTTCGRCRTFESNPKNILNKKIADSAEGSF
jgi:hypothetical protein